MMFQETQSEHARRLGATFHWTRVRRRVLKARVTGTPVQVSGDVPYKLLDMSVEELCRTLKVVQKNNIFIPDPNTPTNSELKLGQMYKTMSDLGWVWGGSGKPRVTLTPPYGYRTVFREIVFDDGEYHRVEIWESDGEAGRAISFAFDAMASYAEMALRDPFARYRVSWKDIAEDMNRQGFARRDGSEWKNNDVRSLLRAPTYAGYGWLKARGFFRHVPIVDPLVEPVTFVVAALTANASYNKIRHWFLPLLSVVGQVANKEDRLLLRRLIEISAEPGNFSAAFTAAE